MNLTHTIIPLAALLFGFAATAAEPVANLALDAAADYRAAARYPASSWPLLDAVDPIVSERTPSPISAGNAPRLSVWTSGVAFEAGQTVALFAQMEDTRADATLMQQTLAALGKKPAAQSVRASIRNRAGETLGEVVLRDDGRGADALAGDRIYSAQWTLPAARQPAAGRAESLLVRTVATLADGRERVTSGGFQYSHPGAALTGRYRDAVENGSLKLLAEVEVNVAGRYHLSGTLADALGAPRVQAQAAQVLAPGKHWIALDYYGLILRELGVAGPLTLASVTLSSTQAMPNALGPVLRDQHRLAAIPLAALTDKPFGQPELLDAAARLERSASR